MGNGNSNLDENDDDDDDEGMSTRDGRGQVTSIPNEVRPRPKIGRQTKSGKSSANGSKSKTESLRSALSVDAESQEVERIKREFELFRMSKENQLTNIKKKEKKLETENKKLKTELQALQKTCKKLRDERDFAMDGEQRARMRASAIENDRDKIQRQFKIFRETKENELQSLLKTKRNLEGRLMKLESDENKDENYKSMEQQHRSYFNDNEHQQQQFTLERNQSLVDIILNDSKSSPNYLTKYMSRDLSNVVDVYLVNGKGGLQSGNNEPTFSDFQLNTQKICDEKFHICNFWLLENSCNLIKIRNKILKNPTSNQNASFLIIIINIISCREADDDDDDDDDLQINVEELGDNVFTFNSEDGADMSSIFQSVQSLIINEIETKDCKYTQDCLNYLGWDNIWYWQRQQDYHYFNLLRRLSENDATCTDCHLKKINYQPYFDQLLQHVTTPGPQPPLLIEAPEATTPTSLLVKWVDECHRRSTTTLIITYFFISPHHSSSDLSIAIKCIMFQVMQCLSMPFALHSDPNQFILDFPKWLDKISVLFPGGVVLVIDHVDYVENFESRFDWLTGPLPADLRVIVSTNQNVSPGGWRTLPTLRVSPLQRTEIKQLFDLSTLNYKSKDDINNDDDNAANKNPTNTINNNKNDDDVDDVTLLQPHVDELLDHLALNAELCHVTYADVICRVFAKFRRDHAMVERLKDGLLGCRNPVQLYRNLFNLLECLNVKFCQLMKVLMMISYSKDGLTEFDLLHLIPFNNNINNNNNDINNNKNNNDKIDGDEDDETRDSNNDDQILNSLLRLRSILKELLNLNVLRVSTAGMYSLHNIYVHEALKQSVNLAVFKLIKISCYRKLVSYFRENARQSFRNVSELLWLKMNEEEDDGDGDGDDDGDGDEDDFSSYDDEDDDENNEEDDVVSNNLLMATDDGFVNNCSSDDDGNDRRGVISKTENDDDAHKSFTSRHRRCRRHPGVKNKTICDNNNNGCHHRRHYRGCNAARKSIGKADDDGMKLKFGSLQDYLQDISTVVCLLERGASSEVYKYWSKLGVPITIVADIYMKRLMAENDSDLDVIEKATFCQRIGRFLMDWDLHDQASMLLQKALELLETQLDPDDPNVGYVLDLLSVSHEKLGHRSNSEALRMQALEIFKSASQQQQQQHSDDLLDGGQEQQACILNETLDDNFYDNNNVSDSGNGKKVKYHYNFLVAAQLDALANLYQRQGKHDQADNFVKRAVSLRKKLTKRVTFAQEDKE